MMMMISHFASPEGLLAGALAGFATPRALAERVSGVTERANGGQLLMRYAKENCARGQLMR